MQRYALTVDKFLDHAAKWFSESEVVEASAGSAIARSSYSQLRERSNCLSGALLDLGLNPGDRVATLAWNTLDHFTVYYAAMGVGLVCHTLNPRLVAEQLAAMIAEADDRVLAVSSSLLPLWDAVAAKCPSVEHVIVLDDGAQPGWIHAANVVHRPTAQPVRSGSRLGRVRRRQPAGLCYTSGTTGKPKGVLYTHRSNYLHTLRALQADAMALTARDVVLARGADVSRQRLGLALRGARRRREAGAAGPHARRREPRAADARRRV